MSDGPPTDGLATDEQLRRIQRGVQRRIDLRRRVAHRLGGAAAGLALLGGGLALVAPVLGGGFASNEAASAPQAASGAETAPQVVLCHWTSTRDSPTREAAAPAGADAARIAASCDAVDFQNLSGGLPSAETGRDGVADQAESDRPPAVVCRAVDGSLHVFPADAIPETLCSRNDMTLP